MVSEVLTYTPGAKVSDNCLVKRTRGEGGGQGEREREGEGEAQAGRMRRERGEVKGDTRILTNLNVKAHNVA